MRTHSQVIRSRLLVLVGIRLLAGFGMLQLKQNERTPALDGLEADAGLYAMMRVLRAESRQAAAGQ
jgi:hypothetical protein